MLSKRGFDKFAGILFISIFVAFAIALLFGETSVDWERDKIEDSLQEIIDNEAIWTTSVAFFIAGAVTLILAAGPLYPLVSGPTGRDLALFGLVGLLSAGIFVLMAQAVSVSLGLIARDFVDGVVTSPDELVSTARAMAFLSIAVPFAAAFTLLGIALVPTGVLIVRRLAVPKWMGWWAIVSGARCSCPASPCHPGPTRRS